MRALDRLHADVRQVVTAALAAVDPERLMRDLLPALEDGSSPYHLLAIGKAAPAMARGAAAVLGRRMARGIVLTTQGTSLAEVESKPRFRCLVGGHPLPDEDGVAAAREVETFVAAMEPHERLLCLISGGGSALLTLPAAGLTLDDIRETTEALLRAGASIGELNTVRKHIERLKGGGLTSLAAPSRVTTLLLSDVIGDPVDVIASGPTAPDSTTFADASRILQRLPPGEVPPRVLSHVALGTSGELNETAKPGDAIFDTSETTVIGCNRDALRGAAEAAKRLGYNPLVLSSVIEGEAREVGGVLAAIGIEVVERELPLRPPACILAGGETTVTVRGTGRGGRNHELALGAAMCLARARLRGCGQGPPDLPVVLASIGTDGIDGSSPAAGVVVDAETIDQAAGLGLDVDRALDDNDTHALFAAMAGQQIVTGPTGTNVMDIQVVLIGSP